MDKVRPASGLGDVEAGIDDEACGVRGAGAAGQPGAWCDDEAIGGHVERVDLRPVRGVAVSLMQLWIDQAPALLGGVPDFGNLVIDVPARGEVRRKPNA